MTGFFTYAPGYSCNNNCVFCTRPNNKSVPNVWGFVEDKNTKEIICDLGKIRKKFDGIILTGGEPTIRKDFFKLLQKCVELDYKKVSIQTNGRMFSSMPFSKKTLEILGNRIDIFFSFHSSREQLFDELAGVKGAFQEGLHGLKNLVELKIPVRANLVVMKPNFEHLPETVGFLASKGIKSIELMFVHPNGMAWINQNKIVPRIEETIPFIKRAILTGEKKNVRITLIRFPLCLLGKFKKNASELFLPSEMIIENPKIRIRGRDCKKCRYYNNCSGIWAQYLKIFDFEFRPFDKTKN